MAAIAEAYFSDFDWTFTPHPKTGDVSILTNSLAIKRSLKNIIFTKFSERRFYSNKGCGLYHYLFEPLDIITRRTISSVIETAIQNFEPRVEVNDIRVSADAEETGLYITLYYTIINSTQIDTTTIFLERSR